MGLFAQVVHSLDSSPLSLIWIVLLIDCFVNTDLKGPQKVWWIIFIFLTHFFGALLYFFVAPAQIYRYIVNKMNQQSQPPDSNLYARSSKQKWYSQTLHHVYRQPSQSPGEQQNFPEDSDAYRQGYRAQEGITSFQAQEADSTDSFYEEPQASYPEMTQEQK